jgi:RecB family endonuclease NucS
MNKKPYVWEMVKEAIEDLDGKASYSQIKDNIKQKYGGVNESTITAQIIVCTVNHKSRIHYPINNKTRTANLNYDFLYTTGPGQVECYDPEKHGVWEIAEDDYGKLIVRMKSDEKTSIDDASEDENNFKFPLEDHLRDFIVQNIESIKINEKKIELYVDDSGRTGVEYDIRPVGRIDILTVDEDGNFVVFELKVEKGPDSAVGQVLRYMGWVKNNLADGKKVSGVIVSKKAGDKIKYAASMVPEINLFEYEMSFQINEVSLNDDKN